MLEQIISEIGKTNNRLDGIYNRLDGMEDKISHLEKGQKELGESVNILIERSANTDSKLDKIESKITELTGETKNLEAVTKENLFDIAKLKSTN